MYFGTIQKYKLKIYSAKLKIYYMAVRFILIFVSFVAVGFVSLPVGNSRKYLDRNILYPQVS